MSTPSRLALFAVAVAAAFGIGFGVGDAVGPFDDEPVEQHAPADPHGWHGGTQEQP